MERKRRSPSPEFPERHCQRIRYNSPEIPCRPSVFIPGKLLGISTCDDLVPDFKGDFKTGRENSWDRKMSRSPSPYRVRNNPSQTYVTFSPEFDFKKCMEILTEMANHDAEHEAQPEERYESLMSFNDAENGSRHCLGQTFSNFALVSPSISPIRSERNLSLDEGGNSSVNFSPTSAVWISDILAKELPETNDYSE